MDTTRNHYRKVLAVLAVGVAVLAAACVPAPASPLAVTSTIPKPHSAPRECGLPYTHRKCTAWKAYNAAYNDLRSRAIRQSSAQADSGYGVIGRFYRVAADRYATPWHLRQVAKASWSGSAACQQMIVASALRLLNQAYKGDGTEAFLKQVGSLTGKARLPGWSVYWQSAAYIGSTGANLVRNLRIREHAPGTTWCTSTTSAATRRLGQGPRFGGGLLGCRAPPPGHGSVSRGR